jgi:para-aminobenzoate synthetase component 1
MNFALILKFDHDKKKLTAIFDNKNNLEQILKWSPSLEKSNVAIKNWSSNFTNESYINAILDIKNQIAAGDFYQTNLTRKFFGEFQQKQNHQSNFQLFTRLTELSPANYSAFLKIDENYIISSSPELFLKAKNNRILSRPIKGTAPRDKDLKQDEKNKLNLKKSLKERAENLMIVDLVRNDLARICEAGSVVVKKLFEVISYQNIHHMSSEIHGKIAPNFSAFDAIKSCFPAGSMTGAPKIKAMEIAAKKEKLNRGIYSGSIGLFSKNEINSSVVIRTLILQENKFEFQVGGAITFDSDPKAELEETFNKAKGIAGLLQVDVKS